jgi:hypothetical protein
VKLAQRHPVEVNLDELTLGGDAGVVAEAGPQDEQDVRTGHGGAGDGRAAAAEDATGQGVVVGDAAFGLEGGDDGGVDPLGQGYDFVGEEAAAIADDDARPLGLFQHLDSQVEVAGRRADAWVGQPAVHGLRLGAGNGRHPLYLVGKDEVADVPLDDGVFEGQGHQLGGVLRPQHRLAPGAHRFKGFGQRHFLESARPQDLGVDLAGQRQDGHAVHLGVPQAGQQVGRARTGDAEAGRRPAG